MPPADPVGVPTVRKSARRQPKNSESLSEWGIYHPSGDPPPEQHIPDPELIRIGDTGMEAAGISFALASVINLHRTTNGMPEPVSPRMLYENARRYDPWSKTPHEGSSLEATLEGFHKHGVCLEEDWPYVAAEFSATSHAPMKPPPGAEEAALAIRPAAIERIQPPTVENVQAAIVELGAVLANVQGPEHWSPPGVTEFDSSSKIPRILAAALIGYTKDGFLLQYAWGESWGSVEVGGKKFPGVVLLTYHDIESRDIEAWAVRMEAPAAPSVRLAGYESDGIDRDDCLDIMRDVRAISAVLAARNVKPPVAVGLFGDWGTGKSFFMSKLQRQVEKLETVSKAADGKSAYCSNVVQIPFNAWHYLDADLWASLVSEIFAKLFEKIDTTSQRQRVEKELTEARGLFRESQMELDNARWEHQRARAAHERARRGLEAQESTISELKDQILELLGDDDELRAQVTKIADDFGIRELASSFSALQEQASGLRSNWTHLKKTLKSMLRPQGWRSRFLLFGGFLAAGLLIGWIATTVESPGEKIKPWLDAVNEWSASAVVLVTWLTAQLTRGSKLVSRAQDVFSKVEQAREKNLEQKLAPEREALDAREAEEKVAAERFKAAGERLLRLEEELRDLDPRRQMYRFIEERNRSEDYRSALGLVTLIRKDFEKLSDLLKRTEQAERDELAHEKAEGSGSSRESQDDEEAGPQAEEAPPMPVQRILLYIDDLDRCKPERVVAVLEAVHLLLAFRLFVVVVAVDPRWLRRCLEKHYPELLRTYEQVLDQDRESRLLRASTPQDYLEKIFQIPFYLRPLSESGYKSMIQDLAGDDVVVAAETDKPSLESKCQTAADGGKAGRVGTQGGWGSLPGEGRKVGGGRVHAREAIDPKQLQFKEHELENMKRLSALFHTPRAAKRFVNTYRLIRVGVSASEIEGFEGSDAASGEHRVALTLLAVVAGCPNVAPRFLKHLIDTSQKSSRIKTWERFLKDCFESPKKVPPPANATRRKTKKTAGRAPKSTPETEPQEGVTDEEWRDLGARLARVTDLNFLPPDLEPYQRWAPRVARYSFSVSLPRTEEET